MAGSLPGIAASAAGGLLGGKGGGSSPSGTQTITTQPPGYALPFFKTGLQEAAQIYADPFARMLQPFSGVAPFSKQTLAGLGGIQNIAAQGYSPLNQATRDELTKTIGGGYLGQNPYLSAMFDTAKQGFLNPVNLGFEGAGRTGSGLHANAAADALSRAFDTTLGAHYEAERDRQQRGLALSPSIDATRYEPMQALLGVGGALENQGQRMLDEASGRFAFAQDRPSDLLTRYLNAVSVGSGGGQSETSPLYSNRGAGALGGALGGLGLQKMLGSGGKGGGKFGGGSPVSWTTGGGFG